MEITEVRVKLMDEPGERLQAFCSITFDDAFVVRDLKIIEGATGPFVAMPSRKLTAHCPQCGCKNHLRSAFCNQCGARLKEQLAIKDEEGRAKLYADIAHPINSMCREMIQERVIKAFLEEKDRASQPGYIPSYDDFDHAQPAVASSSPASTEPQPVEPRQIQGAEKPRGPHRVPAQQPQPKQTSNEGFGSGIFE
ncbi:MAG: septation protein SpoVG family protein [Pirellulales bacterium]|nr:septation protein SpoVG family protein [Pirellulales bacterium]